MRSGFPGSWRDRQAWYARAAADDAGLRGLDFE
jgi:hypothetical protein